MEAAASALMPQTGGTAEAENKQTGGAAKPEDKQTDLSRRINSQPSANNTA